MPMSLQLSTRWVEPTRILARALLGWGFVCWITASTLHWLPDSEALRYFEMPLGSISGIAVDSAANIFCFSKGYRRIQAYDEAGRFVMGWFVETSGAGGRIWIDTEDKLHLAAENPDRHYIFSKDGLLLEKSKGGRALLDGMASEPALSVEFGGGSFYIGKGFPGPEILGPDSDGKAVVLVSTPFWMWILKAPIPAWYFMILGAFLLFVLKESTQASMMQKWKSFVGKLDSE